MAFYFFTPRAFESDSKCPWLPHQSDVWCHSKFLKDSHHWLSRPWIVTHSGSAAYHICLNGESMAIRHPVCLQKSSQQHRKSSPGMLPYQYSSHWQLIHQVRMTDCWPQSALLSTFPLPSSSSFSSSQSPRRKDWQPLNENFTKESGWQFFIMKMHEVDGS